MLIVAEALDIDTYAWIAPSDDFDLSRGPLPTKFMPLRFRKSGRSQASGQKLYIRFRDGHFTVYRPQANQKVNPGTAASFVHYLEGKFDVATGKYVPTVCCKLGPEWNWPCITSHARAPVVWYVCDRATIR
jgi:hypothetical protein